MRRIMEVRLRPSSITSVSKPDSAAGSRTAPAVAQIMTSACPPDVPQGSNRPIPGSRSQKTTSLLIRLISRSPGRQKQHNMRHRQKLLRHLLLEPCLHEEARLRSGVSLLC